MQIQQKAFTAGKGQTKLVKSQALFKGEPTAAPALRRRSRRPELSAVYESSLRRKGDADPA